MGKGKYTKEERWEIGRKLYYDEISRHEACVKYGLNVYTVRDYMLDYRNKNNLPPKAQSVGWRSVQILEESDAIKAPISDFAYNEDVEYIRQNASPEFLDRIAKEIEVIKNCKENAIERQNKSEIAARNKLKDKKSSLKKREKALEKAQAKVSAREYIYKEKKDAWKNASERAQEIFKVLKKKLKKAPEAEETLALSFEYEAAQALVESKKTGYSKELTAFNQLKNDLRAATLKHSSGVNSVKLAEAKVNSEIEILEKLVASYEEKEAVLNKMYSLTEEILAEK